MTRTTAALALLIFVLALVPRLAPKENFTQDETQYWVGWSENFLTALQTGDFAATAQSFHPGAMTLWTGAASIRLDRAINGDDHAITDNLRYRMNARWGAALVNSVAVAIAFLLLVRLFNLELAFVASLLWALDIFGIEHGGVLHVDGLATSFMFLAFLAGLLGLRFDEHPYHYQSRHQVNWRWWVLSGVLGGLAIATKYTTASMTGILALIMLIVNFRHFRVKHLIRQISPFMVWLLIAAITFFVAFPAMWSLDFERVWNWFQSGTSTAFAPHFNYFMGKPITVPPPTYYLVALALRITPIATVGLIVIPFALRDRQFKPYREQITSVFVFMALFLSLMMLQPKQLDRYISQVFPVVDLLAAFGIVWLIRRPFVQRLSRNIRTGLAIGGIASMILFWWIYYPQTRAYYNPLLGGGATAVNVIAVGDGEGFDDATQWIIDQHPNDLCDQKIATPFPYIVRLYVPCADVVELADWKTELQDSDYVLMYVWVNQRVVHETNTAFAQLYTYLQDVEPAHRTIIHGIDYVQIYDLHATPLAIDWNSLTHSTDETAHD